MIWLAKMDSEHFGWIAAGTTAEDAREALAAGFLRFLTRTEEGDEAAALERFAGTVYSGALYRGSGDGTVTRENLAAVLDEWYGIGTAEVHEGTCLRDLSVVA